MTRTGFIVDGCLGLLHGAGHGAADDVVGEPVGIVLRGDHAAKLEDAQLDGMS